MGSARICRTLADDLSTVVDGKGTAKSSPKCPEIGYLSILPQDGSPSARTYDLPTVVDPPSSVNPTEVGHHPILPKERMKRARGKRQSISYDLPTLVYVGRFTVVCTQRPEINHDRVHICRPQEN